MSNARPKLYLGFLTVVDRASYGLIGGYLILNTAGRPLEFHCTTPVRPSRAQQILYGPTLEPYLFGEQIGQSLLSKAKLEPLAVCTDRVEVLAVREYTAVPVALVLPPEGAFVAPTAGNALTSAAGGESGAPANSPRSPAKQWRPDTAHLRPRLLSFSLGRNRLAVAEDNAADRQRIEERLASVAESFDLGEPFGRIREAIEEASGSR